jgi:hypothetical protein
MRARIQAAVPSALWALLFLSLAAAAGSHAFLDPLGAKHQPFQTRCRVHVFLFVRTDCPITNRYAPELGRIAGEFGGGAVDFWLVYSDRSEQPGAITRQIADYRLPGTPLLDPTQELARRAEATVSPQAAVFDDRGHLTYSGRIDDRVADFGKARPEAATHDLEDAITATLDHKPVAHPHTLAVGCFLADVR